jgi:hypothetical protein
MINFRKVLAVGLAVTTLGLVVAATSTPAVAWGGFHHGWGWGLGGVAAGLALGATAAASAPYYGYGQAYPGCYISRQPIVDIYGNIVSYRRVRVCD